MGFPVRLFLLAAAPLLLAAPVHAQQAQEPAPTFSLPPAGTAPAPNPNRQGPELDVYRDQPRTAPPVVAPTVVPPPVPVQPAPTPQSTPPRPMPVRPAPEQPRATRPAEREAPATVQPTPAPVAPTNAVEPTNETAPIIAPSLPAPATNAVETPEAVPAIPTEQGSKLPWVIGGALALVALAAFLLLRRRRPVEVEEEPAPPAVEVPPPAPAPVAPPAPVESAPPPPAPVAAPEQRIATTGRPWLDMDMAVSQARYSLMGLTIVYSLILHNRGDRPAQDILIRGIVGNAGAQQQALLQGFFAGDDGLPLHSAVSIEPGETRQLAGELRLSPEQIVPVEMGQRSLLIPLAAFDLAYRWDAVEDEALGHGRTARAFIVGQEQEPRAARLAPLRLDQGPRQYRRPAARAAAELAPA
ncbi:hypothetical protein MOK15_13065 [Sphingobium sp. BYY-5]|uniref:hypothetical protein n=1 Tax=Sphingobium sp. BYY-5 TaxID=2926400 RepID=UPI001FA6F88B|nr:hypothetical protein [Sphingobium sp. BYY-5]MCI4591017.1 hypothetical protein [Sphingobium sp. BYY-5]